MRWYTVIGWDAVENVNHEAEFIWNQSHGCDDCGMDGTINPECPICKGEGVIL